MSETKNSVETKENQSTNKNVKETQPENDATNSFSDEQKKHVQQNGTTKRGGRGRGRGGRGNRGGRGGRGGRAGRGGRGGRGGKSLPVDEKGELLPVPKAEKPDETKHQQKIDALYKKVDEYQEQLAKIRDAKEDKSEHLKQLQKEKDELFQQINAINEQLKQKNAEKEKIVSTIAQIEGEKDELIEQRNKMNEELKYKTVEAIDKAIKKIEDEISSKFHTNQQQKIKIARISKLEKSKGLLKIFEELSIKINAKNEKKRSFDAQLQKKNAELKVLYESRQGLYDKVNALNLKIKQQNEERKGTEEKRMKIRDQIKKTYDEINKAKDEFRKQKDAYHQYERYLKEIEFRERKKKQEERRKKLEEMRKEREERKRKELEQWQKEMAEYNELMKEHNPYELEIKICQDLINYLIKTKKQIGSKKNEFVGGDIFTGLKKKSKQRKNESIKHSIDKFSQFNKVGVEIPLTYNKIDQALENLRAKQEVFKNYDPKKAGEAFEPIQMDQSHSKTVQLDESDLKNLIPEEPKEEEEEEENIEEKNETVEENVEEKIEESKKDEVKTEELITA